MLNEKDLKRTNIEEKREENKATVKRDDEKYRIYRQMINTFYGEEQSEQRIKK